MAIQIWSEDADLRGVVVDALLGTGLAGAVREPYAHAIRCINASCLPVLAVDIPSGLSADSGAVLGVAVRADLTVTFIGLKLGLFTGDAPELVGELAFDGLQADLGLVAAHPVAARRLAVEGMALPGPRPATAHKGRYGRLLVVGGDLGTGGAALLSAESALRSGAGMVSLATRGEHVAAALARMPEVMSIGVASANQLRGLAAASSVLVVGPGLGQNAWGRSLMSAVVAHDVPQVWDADALNLLAAGRVALPAGCIITPHPGEAARLLGVDTASVQADRPPRPVRSPIATTPPWCSGAGSLVASADGRLALCDRGIRLWRVPGWAMSWPASSAPCWRRAWRRSTRPALPSGCMPVRVSSSAPRGAGWRPVT